MGKVIKWVSILVLLAALLIAGGLFYLASNLGTLITRAVNEHSERVVGVPMQVGKVDISLLDGRASLSNFNIPNPAGFSSANSFELKQVIVQLDLESLRSDVIVIENITVNGAAVLAEELNSRINLKVLKDNLKQGGDGASASQTTEATQSELPKIAIAYFEFSDASARVTSGHFAEQQVAIPSVVLENIGTAKDGITLDNAADAIFQPLLARIIEEVQRQALNQSINKAVEKEIDKVFKDGKTSDAVKGLLKKF
jgi:hypothetical protein